MIISDSCTKLIVPGKHPSPCKFIEIYLNFFFVARDL